MTQLYQRVRNNKRSRLGCGLPSEGKLTGGWRFRTEAQTQTVPLASALMDGWMDRWMDVLRNQCFDRRGVSYNGQTSLIGCMLR